MAIKKIGWGFGLCNMKCDHCYNSSDMQDSIPRFTFDQLRDVADKVCPDVRDINFGTGEFFCNPNAVELARYIASTYAHVDLSLTTNGYTVVKMSQPEVKHLFNDIDVSLDFPDRERHNAFRHHPLAWEWAIRALEILKEIRMQHTIVVCLTSRVTDEDLLSLLRLADSFEAFLRINWFRHTGRGSQELRVSAERAWAVIKLLADKATFCSLDSIFSGPLNVMANPCPAGRSSARIHQDMSVTAYPFLKGPQWSAGYITDPDMNLERIYQSPVFQQLRNRKVDFCETCEFVEACGGGCITRAALHNYDFNQIDDYCPVYSGLMDSVEELYGRVTVQKQGNLVHDGYLCTTILKPHKGV